MIKKSYLQTAISVIFPAVLSITSACAPTIKNFENYQRQFISKSDFAPDEKTLNQRMPKVAIFDFDENEIEVAKQSSLGKSIAKNVENIVSKFRIAEIVDRSATVKLQKEIQLSEINKTGSYSGPKVADYAISGGISNSSFVSKFSSGSTIVNPKTGQLITIPPKFTYSADVAGNIKIYELPSLTVVKSIEIKGRAVRSENVQNNGGISFGGLQIGGKQAEGAKRDDGLVRKAAEDAISDSETDLRNSLAKKGYILEKRSFEGKSIYKISLGSDDGLIHGDKFQVFGQYEIENPISGKSEIETRIIAKGKVSDKIDPRYSWVVLENPKSESLIRIGDAVKTLYSRSALKSISKVSMRLLEQ